MTTALARPTQVTADVFRSLWWIAATVWGGLYLLLGVIGAIIATTAGLHESVWIGACWWSQYLLMAAGTTVTSQYLRVYVAAGVTRRVVGRGALLLGLLGSVLFGIALELGFVIERGLTMLWGAPPFPAAADFVGSPGQILISTLEFSLLHAAYFFGGWLIAATFHRFGAVAGILMIPPALVPGLLMDALKFGADPVSGLLDRLDITGLSWTSLLLATAVLVAVSAATAHAMVRNAPIKAT